MKSGGVTFAFTLVFVWCFLNELSAQEWTRFRGPNGSGISHAKTIPTEWKESDFLWRVDLPGTGHSSPVLWGDRVFVTSTADEAGGIHVLCLRAKDGTTIWRRDFSHRAFPRHKFNSFASATPAVDADRLYLSWNVPERYTLMALDHEGKTVWDQDLGPYKSQHGCGTSPIVHEGKVILANEQDGPSFVGAVDAASGRSLWRTPRNTAVVAYSTPCIYQPKGGAAVLIFNSQGHGVYAVDPASGKVAWEFAAAFDKRSVSSPCLAGDLIIGSCGSGGGGNFVAAIRAGDPAHGLKPALAFQMKKSAPYVPTALAFGQRAWLWSDGGILTCVRTPGGEIVYQERVGGNFFGSPVWVDKRLFAVSTSGEVVVVEAGDQFKVLARHSLNDTCHSTPAISGERMFVRTEKRLHCIGAAKASDRDL
jgi:outer membrane protein assembly factor BamB